MSKELGGSLALGGLQAYVPPGAAGGELLHVM